MTATRADATTPPARRLSRRARAARTAAAGLVLALLTAGTVVGDDHDFPFGPFRMYATRDDPNGTVFQAVVLARTADGRVHDVTDTPTAPRRAELEGRLSDYTDHPDRFTAFAADYAAGGGVADVVSVSLVRREFRLRDGVRDVTVDVTLATWTSP